MRLRDLGEWEGLRDREREAPGLDQRADLVERIDRTPGLAAAERHPVLPRAHEVGNRHDVLWPARQLDQLRQDATPGHVQCDVHPVGRECAHPYDETLAVRDRLGSDRAQVSVLGRTRRADHLRASHHGELNRGAADTSGGAVDEHSGAAPDADLVERAGGRLDRGRQRGRAREFERRRDRRVVGQHCQLGLGRPFGGEAERAIAEGYVHHVADLVDDPRRLIPQRLRELLVHQARTLLAVARVDAGRAHGNPDLPGPGVRVGKIHDLEDLRATEPAEAGCLHQSLRSSVVVAQLRPDRAPRLA